ncbi:MAG: SDR family NAD(P)-dependent oxidoreductase [Phaeodactylibacter sp.]|nr:SDR family NAD(P)-dependent oxidoreductase [Phaeodactylibacter sp.]
MKLKDDVALITGAGSGIGRAIAHSLARRGCHLALVDIKAEGLAETAEEARRSGVTVSTHILDVSDKEAIKALPEKVLGVHGDIGLLVNNAGIAAGGTFRQLSEEAFDRVMEVNFHAVVRLTRAFLPHLLERPPARIVNISSLFGLISPPEQTAYSASKFAVRGFSNALRFELEHTGVGVTVVHPGGVNTNIVRTAIAPDGISAEEIRKRRKAEQKLLRMPPSQAGEIIVKGIEKGRGRILVGTDAKVIALIERLMPVHYWKLLKVLADKTKNSK